MSLLLAVTSAGSSFTPATPPLSIRRAVQLLGIGSSLLWASACLSQDSGVCRTIEDEKARASCISIGQVADPQRVRAGLTSVRTAVQPISPARVAAVTGREIAAAPDRFVGREVAMRSSGCRYVDVNQYVCRLPAPPAVRVEASVVMPVTAQVAIETGAGCSTRRAGAEPDCAASLHLMPSAIRKAADGTLVVTTPTIWVREIMPERSRPAQRRGERVGSARR